MFRRFSRVVLMTSVLIGVCAPSFVYACACGCSVFDVGTSYMFPNGEGGMAFVQYGYQDQNRNWSDLSPAAAANNDDKEIQTHFVTLGLQYMFSQSWGMQAELPYDFRYFKAKDSGGNVVAQSWSQLGDLRVEGLYAGFLSDQSAGLTFGLKLPTGSHNFDPSFVDRDTQIGTGSTDALLGGFYHGNLTRDNRWGWFTQLQLDVPMLIQSAYRPGIELDAAAGIDLKGLALRRVKIVPLAQVIFSERTSDSGAAANPQNSGYQRILLSPGVEFDIHPIKINADIEVPVFQNVTGNQLVAPVLVKMSLSYMF